MPKGFRQDLNLETELSNAVFSPLYKRAWRWRSVIFIISNLSLLWYYVKHNSKRILPRFEPGDSIV